MPSARGVSGHISYRRSACLPDTKCHGKGHPDDMSHGIRLSDEECEGIFPTDRAHVFLMQNVMAGVIRTTQAMAYVF